MPHRQYDFSKYHPHLHVLATDGLFRDTGTFYVMKEVDLKPLEALFRAELFTFLKKEGKITDELINKLLKWRHSGFSIDNGVRIKKEDKEGREAIAQYMMRNVFNTQNITYIEKTSKVIYRTGKIQKGENRKNFVVYDAEEFIAAITQHIPKKNFQMTRSYGWYSNKSRGLREKKKKLSEETPAGIIPDEVEVIDVSKYQPEKVPSLTWRECIKKVWKDDPLICPECMGIMKIIAFIDNPAVIKKILKYLSLWNEKRDSQCRTDTARDPPRLPEIPDEIVYVPVTDPAWDRPESPDFAG